MQGDNFPTLPLCADRVKSPRAITHTSPAVCAGACIAEAIGALIWACGVIAAFLWGEWYAGLYLSQGLLAVIVVCLFALVIVHIIRDLQRASRRASRRRHLAERGLIDPEDLL